MSIYPSININICNRSIRCQANNYNNPYTFTIYDKNHLVAIRNQINSRFKAVNPTLIKEYQQKIVLDDTYIDEAVLVDYSFPVETSTDQIDSNKSELDIYKPITEYDSFGRNNPVNTLQIGDNSVNKLPTYYDFGPINIVFNLKGNKTRFPRNQFMLESMENPIIIDYPKYGGRVIDRRVPNVKYSSINLIEQECKSYQISMYIQKYDKDNVTFIKNISKIVVVINLL